MSYRLALSGTSSSRNTSEVYNLRVQPGTFDPWLDAALIVEGVPADQASRLPAMVRDALLRAGATVDRVEWGSGDIRGRLYVRWQPSNLRPAVEYANAMTRFFLNHATTGMPGARLIMERYRIDRSWPRDDLFVYPDESDTIVPTPAAPGPAPLPAQFDPMPLVIAGSAAGGLLLVGLGVWGYGRRVRRNRRRR